jgi:CrcB protein
MHSLATTLLAVALGGALGAMGRFGLSNYFNRIFEVHHTVYLGTMLVNILGSFLMGIIYVYVLEKEIWHPHLKSLLMTGTLGAFTTFSSFSLEAVNFFERGHPWLSLAYVVGTVTLCLAAVACSIWLARQFF